MAGPRECVRCIVGGLDHQGVEKFLDRKRFPFRQPDLAATDGCVGLATDREMAEVADFVRARHAAVVVVR
jgi:hypothetical protein